MAQQANHGCSKPEIAAYVQVVVHQCYLPPPAIFHELSRTTFSSQTLSTDPRTISLIRHAVRNMVKVNTLRIVFGHPNLTDALLRCFFDKHRARHNPVRRLWLENCRISAGCNLSINEHPHGLPVQLDFDGLQSVRLRRLPLRPDESKAADFSSYERVTSRGGDVVDNQQDGVGGVYSTTFNPVRAELSAGQQHLDWVSAQHNSSTAADDSMKLGVVSPLSVLFQEATLYDRRIWEALESSGTLTAEDAQFITVAEIPRNILRSEAAYRGAMLDPVGLDDAPLAWQRAQREQLPSATVAVALCNSASSTLRSLTLDWLLTEPRLGGWQGPSTYERWINMFQELFSLRFPHLRAFQLRNAVVPSTQLPDGLYLLDQAGSVMRTYDSGDTEIQLGTVVFEQIDTACLAFMEAHSHLQCLAWPMNHFFSERSTSATSDIASRVSAVIDNLGRTLVDLRVDFNYVGNGESQSENRDCRDLGARARRRRFIEEFASKMTKLTSIKIEGGVPRDERRETIRALHACPLEKVVMIGVGCPVGNSWGPEGRDVVRTNIVTPLLEASADMAPQAEPLDSDETRALEGEDKDAIWKYGPLALDPLPENFAFEANYGWPPSPPMIHTIATYHAPSVTELKFCGYQGAPVLLAPTPITTPMLAALKHFHNLESLILSLCLSTLFEDDTRDSEIISYWLNARSPSSTALARITDDEPEGWERELKTKYAPDALAWRVTSLLGPLLSEEAKARKGGVNVRASFCIGDWGGIFDLDLNIGRGAMGSSVCLGFKGPREELEPERRRSKLDDRRWF